MGTADDPGRCRVAAAPLSINFEVQHDLGCMEALLRCVVVQPPLLPGLLVGADQLRLTEDVSRHRLLELRLRRLAEIA